MFPIRLIQSNILAQWTGPPKYNIVAVRIICILIIYASFTNVCMMRSLTVRFMLRRMHSINELRTVIVLLNDIDFGDCAAVVDVSTNVKHESLSDRTIDEVITLECIIEWNELLSVLDTYSDVFRETPGLCTLVEHTVYTDHGYLNVYVHTNT